MKTDLATTSFSVTVNGNPVMKLPARKKNLAWVKSIADYADHKNSMYFSNRTRTDISSAIIDMDLYNGKIHMGDLVHLLNPLDLQTIDSSREIKHYPIAAPIIDLLVGEEIKAPFEPQVKVTNNVAIEEKQNVLKGVVSEFVNEVAENFEGDEEQLKTEVNKFQRYIRYTYKDLVEKKASALLTHYWNELNLHSVFIEGYRLALLTAEEAYDIDIINGSPTLSILDRTRLKTWGSNTNRLEDSDIITIEDHYSPGSLIDAYGSQLSDEEVERIVNGNVGFNGQGYDKPYGDVTHEFIDAKGRFSNTDVHKHILDEPLSENLVDSDGNIRCLKVRFKSYKKVKKVGYQDPTTGEQQQKTVDERYRLIEGEVLMSTMWISDWWKVTKIGYDIYTDIEHLPFRYNRLGSPEEGHPGIVGEVYNLSKRTALSAMTRMKPYQYLYDIIIDRMVVAMSKNIGPILEMGLERKPSGWNTKKWLSYIFKYNAKFVDNFNEINKGSAEGQLAGNLASGRDQQLSLDFGNYIQQLVNMAEYVKAAAGDIIGVSPQRKGAIQNRETVGGVERATSQSSYITEWYSYKHEQVKLRALNVFIEAAKSALKDNPKKLQLIQESQVTSIMEVVEDDFINVDLGVFVSGSRDVKEHKQVLEQAAQAYMQNGGSFSFVFDVLFSDSMSEKRRLIEEHEEQVKQDEQKARESESANIKAQTDAVTKDKDKDRALSKYKADLEAKVDLKMKQMDLVVADGKITNDEVKSLASLKSDILKLDASMAESDADRSVKREEIAQKREQAKQQGQARQQ